MREGSGRFDAASSRAARDGKTRRVLHEAVRGDGGGSIIVGVSRASPATECRAAAQLDFWTQRKWEDGVQVDQLRALERVEVRTRNSLYEIIISGGGDVLVRGGRFFPEYTRAVVLGCSLGGAFLKLGGIYRGFSMEIMFDGTRIVTSPVETVVCRPGERSTVH